MFARRSAVFATRSAVFATRSAVFATRACDTGLARFKLRISINEWSLDPPRKPPNRIGNPCEIASLRYIAYAGKALTMEQLGLRFVRKSRGGARAGAGRKRLPPGQRHTPHRARAEHRARHPVHVTLRAFTHSLRSQHIVRTVLGALRDANMSQFHLAHYSIQENHVHLIVEAENKHALSSGMRGLMIRIAQRVNRLLSQRGRFWADRWHGNPLTSPRQVRNALVYVLKNRHKHAPSPNGAARAARGEGTRSSESGWLDPLSSAQWFNGFAHPIPTSFRSVGPPCVAFPISWLLAVGWRRHGLIESSETPKPNR